MTYQTKFRKNRRRAAKKIGCAIGGLMMSGAAFAQTTWEPDPVDTCLYRVGRPVWHFIPAGQIQSNAYLAQSRADNYLILQEGGGVITQTDYLTELAAGIADSQFSDGAFGQINGIANGDGTASSGGPVSNECKAEIEADTTTDADGITLSDALIFFEQQGLTREEIFQGMVETGLASHLPACASSSSEAERSVDELIQKLGDELTEFKSEARSPGRDPSAPIPYGAALNPGWHYVRATMVQSNLAYDRRFWRKYFPALYTELQFDSFGADKKAIGISAEDAHYRHDKNRVRRTLVMNQVVLPPTPYIDGEMRAEISILAVESYDYGRAFMSFLSNVTNGISSKLLSQAENVFGIIDEGIRQLAGTNAEKQFLEAGVAIDWPRPRTGYWLLVWPNKDFVKAYGHPNNKRCESETPMQDRAPWSRIIQNRQGGKASFSVNDLFYVAKTGPSEVTLLVKRNIDKEGTPVDDLYEPFDNATWSLLRIDALSTNPNWQRIPGLLEARQRIIERMLQFYLPDFSNSGTYLDTTPLSEEAQQLKTERDQVLGEERQKFADELEALETAEEREKYFQQELAKDYQFYYGLLMSSPDLLATDKYNIIKWEQGRFQRHLHVLRTTELREQLVAAGYSRWRRRVKKREYCDTLGNEDLFDKATPEEIERLGINCDDDAEQSETGSPASEAPATEEPDFIDENGVDEVTVDPLQDFPGEEQDDEDDATDLLEAAAANEDLTPRLAAMRVQRSGFALTNAVDEFMAAHPDHAKVAQYDGARSIDGTMILQAAAQPDGTAVRAHVANYISDLLTENWVSDPYAHLNTANQR